MTRTCIVAVVLLFTTWSTASRGQNLSFCYDPYPPYTIGSSGTPSGGLKVSLLRAVVKRIEGVDATVTLMPWKRCQSETAAGQFDGILPLFVSDERKSYLAFSEPTFDQGASFLYSRNAHKDGLEWNGNYAEISHLRLGMLNGSIIDADMEAAFESHGGITRARDVSSLMEILHRNRVDLVAIDSTVARYKLFKMGLDKHIAKVSRQISTKHSHFGLSKVNGAADKYLHQFDAIIREMTQSGEIDKILTSTEYEM